MSKNEYDLERNNYGTVLAWYDQEPCLVPQVPHQPVLTTLGQNNAQNNESDKGSVMLLSVFGVQSDVL